MKLVIQRVKKAKVEVVQKKIKVGEINKGILVLVGVGRGDDFSKARVLAEKLSKLRIMADNKGKMNLSVSETNSEVLVVSQFTLYADTSGGRRPSFIDAAMPEDARKVIEEFVRSLRSFGLKVETGEFGSYMEISAVLDGPVTIICEL